ncbi:hypothetical protein ACFVFI_27530 [Streptomyces sp. NPDC057705]|uniref:hypothetical protein n=1 Tax=Streptomyces sp. NPDC057705 TaxID=3346222 RepID=UPI0036CDB9EC
MRPVLKALRQALADLADTERREGPASLAYTVLRERTWTDPHARQADPQLRRCTV